MLQCVVSGVQVVQAARAARAKRARGAAAICACARQAVASVLPVRQLPEAVQRVSQPAFTRLLLLASRRRQLATPLAGATITEGRWGRWLNSHYYYAAASRQPVAEPVASRGRTVRHELRFAVSTPAGVSLYAIFTPPPQPATDEPADLRFSPQPSSAGESRINIALSAGRWSDNSRLLRLCFYDAQATAVTLSQPPRASRASIREPPLLVLTRPHEGYAFSRTATGSQMIVSRHITVIAYQYQQHASPVPFPSSPCRLLTNDESMFDIAGCQLVA